jgi:hypothetical protein
MNFDIGSFIAGDYWLGAVWEILYWLLVLLLSILAMWSWNDNINTFSSEGRCISGICMYFTFLFKLIRAVLHAG